MKTVLPFKFTLFLNPPPPPTHTLLVAASLRGTLYSVDIQPKFRYYVSSPKNWGRGQIVPPCPAILPTDTLSSPLKPYIPCTLKSNFIVNSPQFPAFLYC